MSNSHPVGLALENRLMSDGIYLTDWRRLSSDEDESGGSDTAGPTDGDETLPDGTGFAIEYERVADTQGVDQAEVGAVVRALLAIANERDWQPGRLEATSLTTDGDIRGRWHVERAWFEELGLELDDLEFSRRVLEPRRSASDEGRRTR